MMKSFLFIPHSPLQFEVFGYWAEALSEKEGIRPICLLITDALSGRLSETHSYAEVISLENYQSRHVTKDHNRALEILKNYEEDYNSLIVNHWTVDRAFQNVHYSYADAVLFTSEVICSIKALVEEYTIVGALGETLFLPQRITHDILSKINRRYLVALNDRFFTRFYFEDGMTEWHWKKIQIAYQESKEIPLENIPQIVKDRYDQIISKNFKKGFAGGKIRKKKRQDPFYQKIMRRIRRPNYTNIYSEYLFGDLKNSIWEKLQIKRKQKKNKRDYSALVSQEIPDGKFLLFLFHMQPEYTVDGIATNFYNQSEFVTSIARRLPSGLTLVVKEHPFTVGKIHRPKSYYSDIARHPNIIFLDHNIDSHILLKKSIGVVTLTGTIALEGVFFNKPVIVVGNIFFRFFDEVYAASNIDEIMSLISKIWKKSKIDSNEQHRLDLISGYRLLNAFYSATYEGQMYRASAPDAHRSEENIKLLKKGFLKEISNIL